MRRLILSLPIILAGFAPVAAQPACQGSDLIARMKREEPQRYERLADEAKRTPFGSARLFKVSKGKRPPSWLFGTMHSSDPRALAWIDEIAGQMAQAKVVAVENTQINPARVDPAAGFKLATMMIAKPDELLERYLDAGELDSLAERAGPKMAMPPAAVKRLRPWAIILALAYPDCEAQRAKRDGVVDFNIVARAEAKGTATQGLEPIEEMLAALNEPGIEVQVDLLRSAQATYGMLQDMLETMTLLLDRGETGLLRAYARDESIKTLKNPASFDVFMKSLIDRRNQTMLRSALPLLDKGGAFIAVGALHLPGENGLAKLFADAGYKMEPVRLKRTTTDE